MSGRLTTDGTVGTVMVTVDAEGAVRAAPARIPAPPMRPGELLVQPAFVGICGTDISILRGRLPGNFEVQYPHTLGHEWAGIVQEVGSGTVGFEAGDHVLGHGHLGNNDWFGVTHDGAAADLFAVPARMCYQVPEGVSLMTAAIIEPFACVLNGMKKIGGTDASQLVHVHGLGGIGLCAMLQSIHAGAEVVVFDPSERRRALALSLGASAAIDPIGLTDVAGSSQAACGRALADLVVEASGNPAAQALALEGAAKNGRVLLLGLSRSEPGQFRLGLIIERYLTVMTSQETPVEIWPAAIQYIAQSRIDLSVIVSSVVPFSRATEALDRAQDSGRDIKVMLARDGSDSLKFAGN